MSIPPIPDNIWREWKRKRRNATIGFIIYATVTGMDYSIIFSTLYFYLKNMIKSSNIKFYYGLIICVYCISSSLFGMFAGRFVDKTRRVLRYMNIITVIQIIGCLIYVIPYSEAYPIVARFLIGSGESFGDVCSGEVIRIYDERKGTRALYYISSAYTIGFIIAPAINLLYKGIDFHVFSIPVNYLNFGGIFMAILLTLTLVVNNTLVHDCSAIIDYKEYLKQKKRKMKNYTNAAIESLNEEEVVGEQDNTTIPPNSDKSVEVVDQTKKPKIIVICEAKDETSSKQSVDTDFDVAPNTQTTAIGASILSVSETDSSEYEEDSENTSGIKAISSFRLKSTQCLQEFTKCKPIPLTSIPAALLSNPDSLIIIATGMVFTYCLFATDVILPMIIHDVFQWSISVVMYVYLAYGILSLIILLLMSKLCLSGRKIYYVTLVCIVSVIFQFAVTAAIKLTRRQLVSDAVILSLQLIFSVFGWCLLDVLLRSLMSKMVPSSIQSFTEVFRAITTKASVVIASLTGPFLVPYLHWWGLVAIISMFVILIFFIRRRKHFISIKELDCFQDIVLETDSHQNRTNKI